MQAPSLPSEEISFLATLSLLPRCRRIQELHAQGWSLQSVANAFSPPRRRSTIRAWVLRSLNNDDMNTYYVHSIAPRLTKPPVKKIRARSSRLPSPGIPISTQLQIARLSPLARRYRSRTPHLSPSDVANRELSRLAAELYAENVRVSELARAASVTYRAMKRRLEKQEAAAAPAPAPAPAGAVPTAL